METLIADINGHAEPVLIKWDLTSGDLKSISSSDHIIKLKKLPPPLAKVGEVVIRRTKNKKKDAKLVKRIKLGVSLFGSQHLVNVFNHNEPTTRARANMLMKIMLERVTVHGIEPKKK